MLCRMQDAGELALLQYDPENLSLNLSGSPATLDVVGSLVTLSEIPQHTSSGPYSPFVLPFSSGNFAEWKGERRIIHRQRVVVYRTIRSSRDDGSTHSAPSLKWHLF